MGAERCCRRILSPVDPGRGAERSEAVRGSTRRNADRLGAPWEMPTPATGIEGLNHHGPDLGMDRRLEDTDRPVGP